MGGGEQRGLSVLLNFSCSFRLSLTYIQYQSVSESRISVLSPAVGLFVRIFVVQASFLHVHQKAQSYQSYLKPMRRLESDVSDT